MKFLKGKYALITGGGRGIGKAVALEFAKNGANIAVAALEKVELDQVVEEIENLGVKGLAIPADLSTLEGVKDCVKNYFENFKRCDILVNNAGMTHFSTVVEYPIEKAQRLFNLNIMGSYAMIKQILPRMIENGGGNIIMTSSVHGNMYFFGNRVAYSTSKAAITAMGKSLQDEVDSQNVRVNVILPGAMQTKMLEDMIKWGQKLTIGEPPEAIAPIFLFLASDFSKQRYKGKVINQKILFELLSKIRSEIRGVDYDIKDLLRLMKGKLNEEMYKLFRENQELVDFILKKD